MPPDDLRYPKLDFLPGVLRPFSMIILILCCCWLAGALIFCNIWSTRHSGLLNYDGVGSSRYFLFQYLPQILASILTIWLFFLQTALQRIIPFAALASERSAERSGVLYTMSLFPSNFILPNTALFRQRQPLLGSCFFIFWLSPCTIPLQASAFQTHSVSSGGDAIWRWTAVQPVIWTLVVLYLLLAMTLVTLVFYFSHRRTGVMWDPTSLADILVMLQRSNTLDEFQKAEACSALSLTGSQRSHRLGYWRLSKNSQDIFYALAVGNEPVNENIFSGEKKREKGSKVCYQDPASFDVEGQRPLQSATFESLRTYIHSPTVRYRWTPWFLRDTFVVAWIATAVVLLVAFIVVSFVRQAVPFGFDPSLASFTDSSGFSPAGFLYSFIPSTIGLILFLLWQPFDMYFRALQPFYNLANPRGTSAEESLVLNYTSCFPFVVSIRAATAGHYKVAWFSFISLLSTTLPILGGGIFTPLFFTAQQEVRVAADMPAFYVLLAFLILYTITFCFLWPTRRRRLPHDIKTLAELISFLYQSPLLEDSAFKGPRSKTDLVTRLVTAPPGEKSQPRYAFGVFKGKDGKEHLGIDRLQRPGSGEMLITTGTMK